MSRAETPAKDEAGALSDETAAVVDIDLSELVENMERTDWADVPGISPPEAAAWTTRLIEARDAAREAGRVG